MKHANLIMTVALCLATIGGDYMVFKSKLVSNSVSLKALSDTFVHGAVGLFSALVFFSYNHGVNSQACMYNILLCTFVSSAIDIDHVFLAKSFNIKDLTSLKQRGLLHCTTFWFLLTIPPLIYSYSCKKINIYVLTWMLTIAFTSHHVRDGNRRGLWIYPFNHTPALNKNLYVLLIMAIPNICACIFLYTKSNVYRSTVVEYRGFV